MPTTFPTQVQQLAAYFTRAIAWVIANATRLGVSAPNITALQSIYGDETTAGTYLYCKKQYDIAPNRKDGITTANLAKAAEKLRTKLTEIYNDIPASKWTDEDRKNLNRKTGLKRIVTHPTTRIAEKFVLDIDPHMNALFKCGARSRTDTKRHSIPVSANTIEIRYCAVKGKWPIGLDLAGKVREKCDGPDDNTYPLFFTKAIFEIQLDGELSGYDIYVWGRWVDLQHPELAGEWSEKHQMMIL